MIISNAGSLSTSIFRMVWAAIVPRLFVTDVRNLGNTHQMKLKFKGKIYIKGKNKIVKRIE